MLLTWRKLLAAPKNVSDTSMSLSPTHSLERESWRERDRERDRERERERERDGEREREHGERERERQSCCRLLGVFWIVLSSAQLEDLESACHITSSPRTSYDLHLFTQVVHQMPLQAHTFPSPSWAPLPTWLLTATFNLDCSGVLVFMCPPRRCLPARQRAAARSSAGGHEHQRRRCHGEHQRRRCHGALPRDYRAPPACSACAQFHRAWGLSSLLCSSSLFVRFSLSLFLSPSLSPPPLFIFLLVGGGH